jgi:ABC-type microcin C transport system duplicated ATPase subunit YejF
LRFAGHDLLGISDRERRRLVGKDMAMIFQEPTTSLNPCFTIGYQLVEALRLHLAARQAPSGSARSSCWSRSASRPPRRA